jgi:ankyrin repeat protein
MPCLYFLQNGGTLLHWACYKGNKEIAVALMDRGADIHIKDNVRINSNFN